MAPDGMLRALESLARRLGIQVRFEAFDPKATSRGGLCILRGDPVILVDSGATTMDKVGVLCDALARFDVEILYVPPAIRARMHASAWRPDGAREASR